MIGPLTSVEQQAERACLGALEEGKLSFPCLESKHGYFIFQIVA
jgi:hypothetical protein